MSVTASASAAAITALPARSEPAFTRSRGWSGTWSRTTTASCTSSPGSNWKEKSMRKKSELRGYQDRVIKHLYENDEALAVLKMGAGKTVSTLTAIRELIDEGEIRHALVIAPKRVATIVWPAEIANWEHTYKLAYSVLEGPPTARMSRLRGAKERRLTIMGIDNVQW